MPGKTLSTLSLSTTGALLEIGDTRQLVVLGTYSDGSTEDLTNLVAWSSSDDSIVSNSPDTGSHEVVLARSLGTASIVATAPESKVVGSIP